ncbi:hypothetical protein WJX73_003983 [Symbiochloris irregularis]|uniref:Uncharacterized protein n=1 Tax=Symbiochloris irregularis TaxID=706552 RepID=A0AAW1P403_9CHLO
MIAPKKAAYQGNTSHLMPSELIDRCIGSKIWVVQRPTEVAGAQSAHNASPATSLGQSWMQNMPGSMKGPGISKASTKYACAHAGWRIRC